MSEYCFGDDGGNKDSCRGGPWLCQDLVVLLVSQWWMNVFSFTYLTDASDVSVTMTRGFSSEKNDQILFKSPFVEELGNSFFEKRS